MADVVDYIVGVIRRVARLERRIDNSVRFGPVHPGSVDTKNKTVRLRIGGTDEKPMLSPPIPYSQHAGKLKLHIPPSDHQQMAMISQGGDLSQALAVPFGWSNANPSPSDKDDENILTYGEFLKIALRDKQAILELGSSKIDATDEKITITAGGTVFEFSAAGLKASAADYQFD